MKCQCQCLVTEERAYGLLAKSCTQQCSGETRTRHLSVTSQTLYHAGSNHLLAHQRTQHSIVVRPTAVRAISTDIICQAIVQHCRTSDLELTATCCAKLRLTLCFQIQP